MKNNYLLMGAVLLSSAAVAQSDAGKANVSKTLPLSNHSTNARTIICPDTAGWANFTDFLPEFAANSGQAVFYSYTGGGYIFGNNVSTNGLRIVGQGYDNLNSTPVAVTGVLAWFGGKQSDAGSSTTSHVTFTGWDMAPNKAYNTTGSGTFNSTVANWDGPTGSAKCTGDLLFSDIDTMNNFNFVPFTAVGHFAGDFAMVMDVTPLAAGDTVGLVSDSQNDANNLDFTYHKIGTKWYVTDQLFSPAASGGSGSLDNDIAMWPVLCDATGVEEFFNGMKLSAYPNPAADKAVISYTLEKNSSNVSLVVFDQTGRKVLENKYDEQAAGTYTVNVETINLSSGMYFYQLNANGKMFTKKINVAK